MNIGMNVIISKIAKAWLKEYDPYILYYIYKRSDVVSRLRSKPVFRQERLTILLKQCK